MTPFRRFRPRLIMNMIEDPKDAETVSRLRRSTRQYLDVDLLHLGVIYRDELQNTALSARLPIIRYKPSSVLSQAIFRVAEKIVQLEDEDTDEFLDLEVINDSFDAAETEAEQDFDSKLDYIEDLLNTGALSTGGPDRDGKEPALRDCATTETKQSLQDEIGPGDSARF